MLCTLLLCSVIFIVKSMKLPKILLIKLISLRLNIFLAVIKYILNYNKTCHYETPSEKYFILKYILLFN